MTDGPLFPLTDPGPAGGYTYLHWLRGWGDRIGAMIKEDCYEPSKLDWMVFRPDRHARDAMDYLGTVYSGTIDHVREFLQHAEWAFADFQKAHPDLKCPACGKDDDLRERDEQTTHCHDCGADFDTPPVDQARRDETSAEFSDLLDKLHHRIMTAAAAIELAAKKCSP